MEQLTCQHCNRWCTSCYYTLLHINVTWRSQSKTAMSMAATRVWTSKLLWLEGRSGRLRFWNLLHEKCELMLLLPLPSSWWWCHSAAVHRPGYCRGCQGSFPGLGLHSSRQDLSTTYPLAEEASLCCQIYVSHNDIVSCPLQSPQCPLIPVLYSRWGIVAEIYTLLRIPTFVPWMVLPTKHIVSAEHVSWGCWGLSPANWHLIRVPSRLSFMKSLLPCHCSWSGSYIFIHPAISTQDIHWFQLTVLLRAWGLIPSPKDLCEGQIEIGNLIPFDS